MTLESELKRVADGLEAVDNALAKLLQLAAPPRMVEPQQSLDPELYGATQWRGGHLQRTPIPMPTADAHVAFLSGQWKRRDGHGVQKPHVAIPPDEPVQQLDPWARRSPPTVDV